MQVSYFGVDDSSAHVDDNGKSVVGNFSKSPNGNHIVVFDKGLKPNSKEPNLAIIINGSTAKIMKISRPMSAVITDDGVVAVATITNQEKFTWGLEFYEPSGKKIKALKGYGQKLYLSPDSKFLITQALHIKEAPSRSREINVYDMLTYKKIITTINPIWEKRVSFDTEQQTVTFERDVDETALWISATMSLKTN